jgi:hypothetical protein
MLNDHVALADKSVGVFRQSIGSFLSERERAIEKSIQYRVDRSWSMDASASFVGRKERQIHIGVGLYFALQELSMGFVSPRWGVAPRCVGDYIDLVARATNDNSVAIRRGSTPSSGFPPFSNFTLQDRNCGPLSIDRWSRDEEGQSLQQASHGASVRWVLAHELAHHLKGHVDRSPASLADSRQNESTADRFAFDLITADDPGMVMLALPAYLMVATFSCSQGEEPISTHPSAAGRLKTLLEGLERLERDETLAKRLKDPLRLEETRQNLRRAIAAVQAYGRE